MIAHGVSITKKISTQWYDIGVKGQGTCMYA